MTMEPETEYLTTAQVAKILSLNTRSVTRMIRGGRIKAIDVNVNGLRSLYRVKRSDLDVFTKEAAVEPWE